MRIFYPDNDISDSENSSYYYTKIDNITVDKSLLGIKRFEARSTEDLLKKVKEYYNFTKNDAKISIQLWSSRQFNGIRLDTLRNIPKEYDIIWVRGVIMNEEK